MPRLCTGRLRYLLFFLEVVFHSQPGFYLDVQGMIKFPRLTDYLGYPISEELLLQLGEAVRGWLLPQGGQQAPDLVDGVLRLLLHLPQVPPELGDRHGAPTGHGGCLRIGSSDPGGHLDLGSVPLGGRVRVHGHPLYHLLMITLEGGVGVPH